MGLDAWDILLGGAACYDKIGLVDQAETLLMMLACVLYIYQRAHTYVMSVCVCVSHGLRAMKRE